MDEKIKFKKSFRGYNQGAVDRFFEKIRQDYNNGCAQNSSLSAERRSHIDLINEQTKKISELEDAYKRLESEHIKLKEADPIDSLTAQKHAAGQAMMDAIIEAEIFANSRTAAANAEADQILGKAKREADNIVRDAYAELAMVCAKRDEIMNSLRSSLESIMPSESRDVTPVIADVELQEFVSTL